jgi:hydrogenase-4 membrane subunit HyfE
MAFYIVSKVFWKLTVGESTAMQAIAIAVVVVLRSVQPL